MRYQLADREQAVRQHAEKQFTVANQISRRIREAFQKGDDLDFMHVSDIEDDYFDVHAEGYIPAYMTHELESLIADLYSYVTEVEIRRCR